MKKNIRYVALGDSYTICEGITREESWPYKLTSNLQEKGIQIELIANPSQTGWTTQNLIENELPIFDSSTPNFSTLLIGVNDWVQEVDCKKFQSNLILIINHVQKKIGNNLILITIPDFSATPEGPKYGNGRDITKGIQEFNQIIINESINRKLKHVDIFPLSQEMKNNPDLVSSDGLHPAAKEYALWNQLITQATFELLNENFS